MPLAISEKLYKKACQVIPGGVNSPARSFKAVSMQPPIIKRAEGAYLYDEDGNSYIDYVVSWGACILGHAHKEIQEAISLSAKDGTSFGASCDKERVLAEKICTIFPSIEQVRLVCSGTEACMSVIRLARAYKKRTKILKFVGNYHGHIDSLLVKAGSGLATLGSPDSAGIPKEHCQDTLTCSYNDLEACTNIFAQFGQDIAAVILEPIVGNSGFIRADIAFLEGLRSLCDNYDSLLIFDEVMTGLRVAYGGVQTLTNIKPDLTTLGKVIGGGLPLAAYGGKKELMQLVAPAGPVYQAGTLAGNPIAVSVALKTLELLAEPNFYTNLHNYNEKLCNNFKHLAEKYKIPLQIDFEGGMLGYHFHNKVVRNFDDAQACNRQFFVKFFKACLGSGLYLPPSSFEAAFISSAHQEQELQKTLEIIEKVFSDLHKGNA